MANWEIRSNCQIDQESEHSLAIASIVALPGLPLCPKTQHKYQILSRHISYELNNLQHRKKSLTKDKATVIITPKVKFMSEIFTENPSSYASIWLPSPCEEFLEYPTIPYCLMTETLPQAQYNQ